MRAYINLYRSGFFHRLGKPGDINCHGGDLYLTEKLAEEYAYPASHYLCTIPVEVPEEFSTSLVQNPSHSNPVPLSVSRKAEYRHQHAEEYAHG